MIVGFSKYGAGRGHGPTHYMTDEKRAGRENAPPVVLRGDAELTRQLIDSLEFKHKYTSGVLSFAPDENITPEMEQAIMDRFESMAFAGLENDRYCILWVRHTHAGHHELHFVTPRVELSSGKSMNICPPGKFGREHFDDFRSEINARYGLADPTDPARARNVSTPDYELKIATEALRSGKKPLDNIRELIDGILSERAVQGLIRSRKDVLEHIKDLDLNVTRAGKDYITVSEPQSGQRWRLKGTLYAKDYEPGRAIKRAEEATERDYSRPDQEAARSYAKKVERHITARAQYNQRRYPTPEPEHRLDHVQEPYFVADLNRPQSLSRYLRRQLGNDALLHQPDHGATAQRSDLGAEGRQDQTQQLRQSAMRPDRRKRTDLSGRLQDSEGVLNDRVRNPLIERLDAFREGIQRATSRVKDVAKRLTEDVRGYFARERSLTPTSQQLERSGRQLEQAGLQFERAAGQLQQQPDQQSVSDRIAGFVAEKLDIEKKEPDSGPSFTM